MSESFEQGIASFEQFTEQESQLAEATYEQVKGTEQESYVLAASQLFGLASEEAAEGIADQLESNQEVSHE